LTFFKSKVRWLHQMKTTSLNNTIVNSPNLTATSFGIKDKNLAKIINIVENDIYSDKILAVLREYSCNAYDANVFVGKRNTPIQVFMPSRLEPNFKVRDNGQGLSETDIKEVYTSYGESTKSDSNEFIGALGIGSKSGFAYGDNFVVTSYHNNTKTVYNAVKSATKREIVKLYSEYSSEPSGIEVSIPVKHGDDHLFVTKSLNFFKYWDIYPEIIGIDKTRIEESLDKNIAFSGTNWFIKKTDRYEHRTSGAVAIMGNISYPVAWDLVRQKIENTHAASKFSKVLRFIINNGVVVRFHIGDLEIAPSREALQYTDHTVNNIINRINQMIDEMEQCVIDKINNCKTEWDSKKMFIEFFGHDTYGYGSGLNESYIIKDLVLSRLNTKSGDYIDLHNWDANCGKVDVVKLKSNHSVPFDYVPVLTTMSSKGSSGYRAASYSGNNSTIVAGSKTGIIIMDMARKTHIKSCINNYAEKNSLTTVYLLKFNNDVVKSNFFKENNLTGLEHLVKLSDIFPDFKANLPKRVVKKVDDNCVSAEMYDPNSYFYRHSRKYRNSGTLADVDLSEKGYYLYLEDGLVTINNKKVDVSTFKEQMYNLSQTFKFDVKQVFLFGPKIKNSKKFVKNGANWTDFVAYLDTVVKNKCDLKSNIFGLVFKNEFEYTFSLNKNCLEKLVVGIQDKNSIFINLNNYLPKLEFKDASRIQSSLDVLGFYDKTGMYTQIKKKLSEFYDNIQIQYPMISFMKHVNGFKYIADVPDDAAIAQITNYVNSIDKLNKMV